MELRNQYMAHNCSSAVLTINSNVALTFAKRRQQYGTNINTGRSHYKGEIEIRNRSEMRAGQ